MLCCVGGSASRMGDLLGPPPSPDPDPASRMGDLLGPPPASRMGDLLGPPPGKDPGLRVGEGRAACATYEFLGTFGRGGWGGFGWVCVWGGCGCGGSGRAAGRLGATDCRLGSGGWA